MLTDIPLGIMNLRITRIRIETYTLGEIAPVDDDDEDEDEDDKKFKNH